MPRLVYSEQNNHHPPIRRAEARAQRSHATCEGSGSTAGPGAKSNCSQAREGLASPCCPFTGGPLVAHGCSSMVGLPAISSAVLRAPNLVLHTQPGDGGQEPRTRAALRAMAGLGGSPLVRARGGGGPEGLGAPRGLPTHRASRKASWRKPPVDAEPV